MPRYLLCTNIWNEREKIESMFQMVNGFSLKPDLWMWIDDGSNDGSALEIERCTMEYDLPVIAIVLPPKSEGNLRTIGRAYNYAFDQLNLRQRDFDFMCILDVDNIIHSDYVNSVAAIFELDKCIMKGTNLPLIGVISGYHVDGVPLKMPMGNGKCVLWDIVKNIDKFPDPALDTFLNIKAKAMGYNWFVLKNEVSAVYGKVGARNATVAGAEHGGWLFSYYSGNYWKAIKRVVYRILKRRYGLAFWRGFRSNEKLDEPSRCVDSDVRSFYERA